MGCLKFIFGIIGITILIAGLGVLFVLQGPGWFFTETRETGGASTTQAQLAAETFGATYSEANPPDLPVVIDGDPASTNSLSTAPEIAGAALSDISEVNSLESEAVSTITQNQQTAIAEVQSLQVQTVEEGQIAQLAIQENTVISPETEVEVVPLNVPNAPLPQTSLSAGQGGAGGVTNVEQRLMEIEFPRSFRVGGSGSVRITLKVLPSGEVSVVPEIADDTLIATPILLTDLYDSHTAQFTAHLVAPAFDVEAATPLTQTLERGEEATWRWNLGSPEQSGRYIITLGVDVTWLPKTPDGVQLGPKPIWGQALQVDNNYVFGSITVPQASIGGTALAVVGFTMQIPLFGEIMSGLWKLLFRRRRRRQPDDRRRQGQRW
jgi:hypothetical protein